MSTSIWAPVHPRAVAAIRVDWTHVGLPCLIRGGVMGGPCGYAGVFPESALFGVPREAFTRRAAELGIGPVIYAGGTTAELAPEHLARINHGCVWWVGIDPLSSRGDVAHGSRILPGSRRDVLYVRHATERLAEVLAGLIQDVGHG